MQTKSRHGQLFIVATPLGNLGDCSLRAREVLAGVGLVLAEDTRRGGTLFQALGLQAPGFISLHDHNEVKRIHKVLETLGSGTDIALISDAGTPLVADPGFHVVQAAREAGYKVIPVPGPSAPLAALMASGLPPLPFTVLGFMPRKKSDRQNLFSRHAETGATLIFFERKNRVYNTLQQAAEVLGPRNFCIARELTKMHEEFISGNLAELQNFNMPLLGEITVVIAPLQKKTATPLVEMHNILRQEQHTKNKPKEIARRAAKKTTGWTVKEVYTELQKISKKTQ